MEDEWTRAREGGGGANVGFGRLFSEEIKWPDLVPALIMALQEFMEPLLLSAEKILLQTRDRLQAVAEVVWPVAKRWLLLVSKALLVLCLLSLECGIRGLRSLFRLGSAALFLLVWCTALNLGALAGFANLSIVLVLSMVAAFFLGYTPALALIGLFGTIVLWIYGSFWTTGAVVVVGGGLFMMDHARISIFATMLYASYSAKFHGGWLGFTMCTCLAFVSSDVVVYFLSNNVDENQRSEKASGQSFEQGNSRSSAPNGHSTRNHKRQGGPSGPGSSASSTSSGFANVPFADVLPTHDSTRSSGGASSSGAPDVDQTSAEEEVARVLGCRDHYGVLGLVRFDNIDMAILKREYRKKAMLVHPDKNRGNDDAEEAFKRLQNAYEVLLDSVKRKGYDDDLRREEVLNNFRHHRQGMHQAGRCGSPNCGCQNSDNEVEDDIPADSKRIGCRKCNETHVWMSTDRSKARARWCQECQDYHQAKDGDGWVEQSGQSFFFGMFQKVDIPHAYSCADGKIYDVTEWVICQGMKCPPNTHKPTFHVTTTGTGRSVPRGTNRAGRGGGRGNPSEGFFPDFDENMTEQEFFVWLENAMASGMFSDLNSVPNFPGGRGAGRGKPSRKKRKGKNKQW